MTELSITAAAREAGEHPAIVTATRTYTFADCARLAISDATSIVATPSIATIAAIYAALEARRPLALLHPRLAADELERQRAELATVQLPADTAFVLFTSGSTGRARGVVLSRPAILAAAHASAAHLGWLDDDRWLLCLPLAHAGGLSIVVRCLVARKPIVLVEADVDLPALVRVARPTLASLVPAQLAGLELRDHALRAVLLGGAAAPPALVAAGIARGLPLLPTYGLTETFGQIATATTPGGDLVPLPGVTITADPTIRIRGPMLATCYLDGTPIAPELVTADVGRVDPLVIHGRRDDVIITGGENVHPLEIEAVLGATPGVRAACVFGITDPRWGQVIAAALAVDDTFDLVDARMRWHASLAPARRPRRLAIRVKLPRLPSGKLDRRASVALATIPIDY